jgi:uncharacterized protein
MVSVELIRLIHRQYALNWRGAHGIVHWARVLENGERLAPGTGARLEVVRLFALFHDSGRRNDDFDPEHGLRGAQLAATLRGSAFDLCDEDFELLCAACGEHTAGLTSADATIGTCWDSDRLDLGRVGIRPRPERLSTAAARDPDVLTWAYERSVRDVVPAFVAPEWDWI